MKNKYFEPLYNIPIELHKKCLLIEIHRFIEELIYMLDIKEISFYIMTDIEDIENCNNVEYPLTCFIIKYFGYNEIEIVYKCGIDSKIEIEYFLKDDLFCSYKKTIEVLKVKEDVKRIKSEILKAVCNSYNYKVKVTNYLIASDINNNIAINSKRKIIDNLREYGIFIKEIDIKYDINKIKVNILDFISLIYFSNPKYEGSNYIFYFINRSQFNKKSKNYKVIFDKINKIEFDILNLIAVLLGFKIK